MKRHEGVLNAYRSAKEANLKKPHTLWSQSCDAPEKTNCCGDREKISGCRGRGPREGWIGRARRIFRAVKILRVTPWWWIRVITRLPKPVECAPPRVNPVWTTGFGRRRDRRRLLRLTCPALVGTLIVGAGEWEPHVRWGQRVYEKSLYLPVDCAVNPKLL